MFRRIRALARRTIRRTASAKLRRRIAPAVVTLAVLVVLLRVDAFERFVAFAQAHEAWELDEIVTALFVLSGASVWFHRLRTREMKQEAARRAKAEALLATALNNMHHGISMFDADERLVVFNQRYADIYRFPPSIARSGTTLWEILDYRRNDTAPGEATPEAYHERLRADIRKGGTYSTTREFKDGRCVYIVYEPREGGGWVSTHEDITERRRMEQQLSYLAHHDALTGLANRVVLRERLEAALLEERRGEALALLCLDLDNFKATNDTLGHPVGDELLKVVAARLRSCVREGDVVARMGGDEFAILQLGAEQPHMATSLASRLLEALAEPYEIAGYTMSAGTSIGIAVAPVDGTDADQLIKNADLALYLAKSEGRGVYRFFEPDMDRRMHDRRALEIDLRRALAEGQFELHYQPILDLASEEVRGFEALIRWNHPTRGRIAPGDFIPIAEESGLIVAIGEWVLRQACAEAARWPTRISVAVNVSALQFRSQTLVMSVVSALGATGLAPSRLELEITETILLHDSEATLATLHQLRALGVRIAMDDFGTGYSSLSYFRRFPFDKIKIDRSFIQGLSEGTSSLAILRAIASLAASLNMVTTVEGVENEEQMAQVRHEGIHQVQGYFISPPRPAAEVDRLIARFSRSRLAG